MADAHVLHVDDDADYGSLVVDLLERQSDRLAVETLGSGDAALDRLDADPPVDCIVSDYDMPGMDGIALLEEVRDTHPELPFILFTGKGSEEVASEAIAAGATDYLRKKSGTERYELLANRIENAVDQHRSRAERERVYQALETATQGIGLLDDDGTYVYVNEAYAALYDREPADIVGEDWRPLYPDEEVERFEDDILPTLAAEGTWTGTSEGRRAGGERFPQQLSLSTLAAGGHVCVVQDLTEQMSRQAELQRIERRYEAVFEDPNVLMGLMAPDGTLLRVNGTAMEYVEGDRESIVGEPFWETPWWQSEDADPEGVKRSVERAAEGEYVEYAADLERPSGETYSVEGVVRPVHSESGAVTSLIVSARDVTERRRRERRLARQNERFDEFAEVLSHDLQTPISTAEGRLELAEETGDDEHVTAARRAIERVDDLRRDAVDVLHSREIDVEPEPVTVRDVLLEACESVDALSAAAVEAPTDATVAADREALLRLFENLLLNSVEHGDGDPTIRVEADGEGIYYEDDGPGIDPDRRDEVFTPGVSTKEADGGMGLASVRQIAEAHEWSVDVADARELDGVRFEFVQ